MGRTRPILLATVIATWPGQTWAEAVDITGDWKCEYSVRSQDSEARSAAAWFQVTFKADAKFAGGGKTIAAGSALSMKLQGKYSIADDGLLKMTGVSEIARQRLPFRFVSNVISDTLIERRAEEGGISYHTKCTREAN